MKAQRTPEEDTFGPECPACAVYHEERLTIACKSDGQPAWLCTGCGSITFRNDEAHGG